MEYCEALWSIVEYCGVLWSIVEHCGVLWSIVDYCGALWRVMVCCGMLPCMLVIISSRLFCEDEKFSVSYYVLVGHVCVRTVYSNGPNYY